MRLTKDSFDVSDTDSDSSNTTLPNFNMSDIPGSSPTPSINASFSSHTTTGEYKKGSDSSSSGRAVATGKSWWPRWCCCFNRDQEPSFEDPLLPSGPVAGK